MSSEFNVHYPTAQERAAANFQRLIKVRGGNVIHVQGEFPNKGTADGGGPRFTLFADQAGSGPLCSVARRTTGPNAGADLVVTGADGAELGVLRLPTSGGGGRPKYEMELPDGTSLVGRRGTVGAWILYVLLSPLLLVFNVAGLVGGYGRPDWHLPSRTAWRTKGDFGLGLAPLKFYGMSDKYKVRMARLDMRVVYAQAVLHEWDG